MFWRCTNSFTDHEQKHLEGWLLKKNIFIHCSSFLSHVLILLFWILYSKSFQVLLVAEPCCCLFTWFFFTFVMRNPSASQWKNNIQVTRLLYLPWISVWTLFVSFLFFLSLRKCILFSLVERNQEKVWDSKSLRPAQFFGNIQVREVFDLLWPFYLQVVISREERS